MYLLARAHVDVVDTAQDGSGQLGAEGIPRAVLDLLDGVGAALWSWYLNLIFQLTHELINAQLYLNLLLAVYGIAGN